jgi:ABC-type Zn uptake system ZnuABC Zn-binding protein ZnuA
VPRVRPLLAALLALPLLAGACASDDPAAGDDPATSVTTRPAGERLQVATTVSPITSIASAIVGDRADVRGIVPEGTNSHTFEPQPSVAETLERADVVFINGLKLEEPTKELALANLRPGVELVELGDLTVTPEEYIFDFSFPEEEGKPNPHLWTDPALARRYAEIVTEKVSALDPANADYYARNLAAFGTRVDALDNAMRRAFATIPEDQKELLTYHDAYAYFARNYGWKVIGAIQVSDFEDPTPREVADLIEQIRAEQVPAIFGSEVFPSPVLAQIAEETGARYVDDLRDDDLPGQPGEPAHSWLGLMRFNYATITEALGGDPTAIEAVDVTPVSPDQATYPQ